MCLSYGGDDFIPSCRIHMMLSGPSHLQVGSEATLSGVFSVTSSEEPNYILPSASTYDNFLS